MNVNTSNHTLALTLIVFVVLVASVFFAHTPGTVHAQDVSELRDKISEREQEIQQIEEEIEQYEQELSVISREKQTLESAVRELDVSRRKVNASINLAQRKIDATQERIAELEDDIEDAENGIERNKEALAEALRRMHESESETLVEMVLKSEDISELWGDVETLRQFQSVVRSEANDLASQKRNLEDVKYESEQEQQALVAQRAELATQRRALDVNRQAKNKLLEQTESRESSYQELVAEKRAAKEEFEAQLREFEEQLQYQLDPSTIPPTGQGVLRWPLDNVTITQYFGNTQFARSGAYSGNGHNGVDFGVPIGTPVKAALSGNVKATGDTDVGSCLSYGKWVLIEHVNGLSTLYAHLSDISVSRGQSVSTSQRIGFSGFTGYATGPHLHFTVYASDAVEVVELGTWYEQNGRSRTTACSQANVAIPVSAWEGYLNPMNYLPR